MKPQKIIAFSAIVFGFVVLLGCLAGNYMTVTAQTLNIPLIVMRNGEEVPIDQIRSVQYFITFLRPHPPKGIPAAMLREATNKQGRYVLAAEFTRYVYGPLSGLDFIADRDKSVIGSNLQKDSSNAQL